MSSHSDQLDRICAKLPRADKADRGRAVFAARAHQYRLGPPVPESDVAAFEAAANIRLPDDYRVFLTEVGNGPAFSRGLNPLRMVGLLKRKESGRTGAGPYYGLFPFSGSLEGRSLGQDSIVDLDRKNEAWQQIEKALDALDDDDEAGWDALEERYAQGTLPLGEQGCGAYFALVITGEARGRVVYLSEDIYNEGRPFLCYEANFLDWYERWLDEVIAGDLQQNTASWFGLLPGGSAEALLQDFLDAESDTQKTDVLSGLIKKRSLPASVIEALREIFSSAESEGRAAFVSLLTKHDFDHFRDDLFGGGHDLLAVTQAIHWHMKARSAEALPYLEGVMKTLDDPETFRFCCYVLRSAGDRATARRLIAPYLNAEDRDIRQTARYIFADMKLSTKGLITE